MTCFYLPTSPHCVTTQKTNINTSLSFDFKLKFGTKYENKGKDGSKLPCIAEKTAEREWLMFTTITS
jgi:hypothetical protein